MPDEHSFDHLSYQGTPVLHCIQCGAGGPAWEWPDSKRARHAGEHERERRAAQAAARAESLRAARQAKKEKA